MRHNFRILLFAEYVFYVSRKATIKAIHTAVYSGISTCLFSCSPYKILHNMFDGGNWFIITGYKQRLLSWFRQNGNKWCFIYEICFTVILCKSVFLYKHTCVCVCVCVLCSRKAVLHIIMFLWTVLEQSPNGLYKALYKYCILLSEMDSDLMFRQIL